MTADDKILAIAMIAGKLTYASLRLKPIDIHGTYPGGAWASTETIEFSLSPDRAAELAEQIFDAAEQRVLHPETEGERG